MVVGLAVIVASDILASEGGKEGLIRGVKPALLGLDDCLVN